MKILYLSKEIWAHVTNKPSLMSILYGTQGLLKLYSMELTINCKPKSRKYSMEATSCLGSFCEAVQAWAWHKGTTEEI